MLASPVAWAYGFQACQQETTSVSCSAYLSGVVDTALLLSNQQAKARFGESFAERALSSRAGEMVKRTHSRYCSEQLPSRDSLKTTIYQRFIANEVDSIHDIYDILAAELSCYRSPPSAGTPSDVTS
ncbi:hypothetical protein [Aeromonas cavernicola]